MEKLFTVKLTKKEWIEVIIALDELAYSRKVYGNRVKKANQAIELENIIEKQITQEIISSTKEESH